MKLRLIPSFLLRAPLLRVADLRRPGAALRAHPLGGEALALASAELAAGLERGGDRARRARQAVERYGRRAAFRPTPHGLLAGVMVGKLGARTAIATAGPRAHRTVPWAQLARLARELLDDPEVRAGVRVRTAPSLLVTGDEATWLALPEEGPLEVSHAEVDPPLAAVLAVAGDWTSWDQARAAAAAGFADEGPDEDELDDYLMLLIDQDLLHVDLRPPLVGPEPVVWARGRLTDVPGEAAARARSQLDAATAATLIHQGEAVLSRAVAERAASLAPLLFRLQEALAPPASERELGPTLRARLEGVAELFGAGPFDLAALATGAHGGALASVDEEPSAARPPDPPLLSHLVTWLTEGARAGRETIELDPDALEDLLPPFELPPTFELVLTPRGGSQVGWLLGLHAPAGASWGRYAHALGAPMTAALDALADTEAESGAGALDVSYAPSAELADLCAHPAVRPAALAVVAWPDGAAVTPRELALVIDPGAPSPLALAHAGASARPSPLHRVRSTTAPPGLYQLLAGWSFVRQHAPWALTWGALGDLPRLPRVELGGFVIAPASWRIPAARELKGAGLRRWRRAAGLPRQVQVGQGDELLLVDLDAPGAAADLARHAGARAHEIWPPLDELADRGGRRVEAVVAVVRDFGEPVRDSRPVPTVDIRPAPGWSTYKLFGDEDRQDDVLLAAVAPAIGEAQAAGSVERWHFLRYVEAGRDHLRVRVRAPSERAASVFARALRAHLQPLREAGALATLEIAEYFPEHARYGGAATFALVERLFELDSELVLRLLFIDAEAAEPPAGDRVEWLVRAWDALGRGLGLELPARQALAARRRGAHLAAPTTELDADFRARQRRLAALLAGQAADPLAAPLDAHATRVQAIVGPLEPAAHASLLAVLAPVLHVGAVRLLGPRPDDEAAAYYYWERTLEGLAARRRARSE